MPIIYSLYRTDGITSIPIKKESMLPHEVFAHSSDPVGTVSVRYLAVMDGVLTVSEKIAVDLLKVFTLTDLIAEAINYRNVVNKISNTNIYNLTWEDIEASITDKHILGYSEPILDMDNVNKSLRVVQVLHHDDFELSYCMMATPEDRNDRIRRWQLLDAAITKVNNDSTIDLNNCLLSVNGCISRPFMYKDELIMPNGARFIHNNKNKTPSVTLLDFSNLGKFEIVPFSECTYAVRNARNVTSDNVKAPILPGYDIDVTLPENINLNDKTVFMVLGYSLYFNNHVNVVSDNAVIISPHLLSLGESLIKSNFNSHIYSDYTNIVSSGMTTTEFMSDVVWREDYHGAFFIVIDKKDIFINKTPVVRYADDRMYIGVPGLNGFMWDDTFHSVVDHTNLQYTSVTDIYCVPHNELVSLTSHDVYDKNYSIEDIHPYYKDKLEYKSPNMFVVNMYTS